MTSTKRRLHGFILDTQTFADWLAHFPRALHKKGPAYTWWPLLDLDIPEDAVVVNVDWSPQHCGIILVMRSKEFEQTPLGEVIPMTPVFGKGYQMRRPVDLGFTEVP